MNSKFRFLSLLLLVLFSTQISFATEPTRSKSCARCGPAGLQALMTQYAEEINATSQILRRV